MLVVKHLFDFFLSLIMLVILSPFFLVTFILVRFKLGAPVFFYQQRPGLHGRPFKLIKFRTMTNATDAAGNLLADSERLISLGRFLRSTSLDELPGLFNVLKGDMSIVGPRPLLMEYLPLYSPEQAKRHGVKPGITGWAQVNGRNAISWEDKFKLDVWYVDNQSFMLDIKILWMTFIKVFQRAGINQPSHATMPFFEGNRNKTDEHS
jgi:sugar transferase EpsL